MDELKLIQINIGKDRERQIEIIEYADKNDYDILMIQEPYTNPKENTVTRIPFGYDIVAGDRENRPKSAILIKRDKISAVKIKEFTTDWIASAMIKLGEKKFVLVSAYLNKNDEAPVDRLESELNKMQQLINKFNQENIDCFFSVDSNCRSRNWGDKENDERGGIMNEFLISNDLILYNREDEGPTFINYVETSNGIRFGQSYVDLTFGNRSEHFRVVNWRLMNKFTLDHMPIMIELKTTAKSKEKSIITNRFNTEKTDWKMFDNYFDNNKPKINTGNCTNEQLEQTSEQLIETLIEALNESTPLMKLNSKSKPWYDEECLRMRTERDRLRKKLDRNQNKPIAKLILRDLKILCSKYKRQRKTAEDKYYGETINRVQDINGLWKLNKKAKAVRSEMFVEFTKRDGSKTLDRDEINRELFEFFVPEVENNGIEELRYMNQGHLKRLEENELKKAVGNTLNKKAPGEDGITYKVIKFLFSRHNDYFENYFNKLLENIYFPKILKRGRVILFQKPNKELNQSKSLRPITLLPCMGKILEQLMIKRLEEELIKRNFYSEQQHGFRKGRSTSTAISEVIRTIKKVKNNKYKYAVMIALDISGAFDNIKFKHIIKNINNIGVEGCYIGMVKQMLTGREAKMETSTGTFKRTIGKGCPQGGKASPGLWVIGMNDLLLKLEKNEDNPVAYADDLAVFIFENRLSAFKEKFNRTIETINGWCNSSGLEISSEKTQMINLGKINIREQSLEINGRRVESVEKLKYLGIMLDEGMKFNAHIDLIEEKINKLIKVINMINFMKKDLKFKYKIIIYKQICLPIMMYTAENWYPEVRFEYQRKRLRKTQRKVLLALSKAYRTISNTKLYELFGTMDINDEIEFKIKTKEKSKEERKRMHVEEMKKNGLIDRSKEVKESRSKEFIWFYTEQGPFNSYLEKFNLTDSAKCRFCGANEESAFHLLYRCENLDNWSTRKAETMLEFEKMLKKIVVKLYRA